MILTVENAIKIIVTTDATIDKRWSVPANIIPVPEPIIPKSDFSTISFTCRNLDQPGQ